MPFALLIIGVVLLIAGVRGTQDTLFTLVKGDFAGSNNFIYWFVAILIIGAIGYIKPLKPISNALLILVVLVLFLTKGQSGDGNFFSQFTKGIASTNTASSSLPTAASNAAQKTGILNSLTSNLDQLQQSISSDMIQ